MTTVRNPTLDNVWRLITRRFVNACNSECYIFRRSIPLAPPGAYAEYQIPINRFWGERNKP